MPAAGGEATRLTDLRHGLSVPEWSPDGTRLAFAARVGGPPEPVTEEDKRKSKPPRVITTMKYRFNGEGFTYDRRRADLRGGRGRRRRAAPAHRGRLTTTRIPRGPPTGA